eukprot:TRINITY_DN24283_c0_g1_i1.p1 TRINITY_DN24283_c0_g1~~TRINITY_DN24283_c0_g1_i1.p1  ORF type:complete len:232 (-),score=27.40 TRINITY_DN24283_c0_g1_i1:104-799(-)
MGAQSSKAVSGPAPGASGSTGGVRAGSQAQLLKDIEQANELLSKYHPPDQRPMFFESSDVGGGPLWRFLADISINKPLEDGTVRRKRVNYRQFYDMFDRIRDCAEMLASSKEDEDFADRRRSRDLFLQMMEGLPEDECIICMERKAEIMLPCTHAFCSTCINAWRTKSDACPMCRRDSTNSGSDDWVLTGSGPDEAEVSSFLANFVSESPERSFADLPGTFNDFSRRMLTQ